MKFALVAPILLSLLCDAQDPCTGVRSSPLGYTANWTVRGDVVYFQVSANTPGWVGIGFSLNRFMPQSDVVVGAADGSGNSFIVDGYATSKSMPQEDANSDLQEASVSRSGGIITMQFARKRVTDDTSRDISLDQCVYLLHAWGRGVRNYASKQYFYHSIRRFVSSRKVCFPNSTLCPPECPVKGQIYYPQCAPCDGSCNQPLVPCLAICKQGCACPRGQVIDRAQNRCVALNECPSKCPVKGQIYYPQCAPCDGTCDQPLVPCPAICTQGCACPRGQVIDRAQNRCVALNECPSKCDYNGKTYNPGDTFNSTDGCNTCTCLNTGAVACTRRACRPKMMCPSVLRPGSEIGVCAELCNSDDDCALDEKCCSNGCGHQCTKGVLCAAVLCLRVNCSSEDLIPAGLDSCCASCRCRYEGKVYNPGDTFPASDGCNDCTCLGDGHVSCTEIACLQKCDYNGKTYNPGDTFNSTDGCNTCFCSEGGSVGCTERACRPKMMCPSVLRPGSEIGVCAELCSSDDDCAFDEKCCSNGCGHQCVKGVLCAAVLCLRVNCSSEDLIPAGPDSCCASCRCRYEGKVYNPGDTFPASDGCNDCTCQGDGRVSCTEIACLPSCTHSLCQSEPKATCSIPCNGGPKVTSCQACYYDNEERSVPKKCRYRCGENPKKKCLRKWAKCVAKKYKRKFGTTPNRLRTASLFKCAVPVPCEDE